MGTLMEIKAAYPGSDLIFSVSFSLLTPAHRYPAWVPLPESTLVLPWTHRAPLAHQSVTERQKQGSAKPLVKLPASSKKPARPR